MALTAQRKQSIYHKKTRGEHHPRGKHYMKAYHPYLPLLMLVIVGLALNSFWSSHAKVLGAAVTMSSQQLLTDTNLQRTQNHMSSLSANQQLSAAAQAKANDMVTHGYWSHDSPQGKTPWNFIQASGYQYQEAGENLAYGFSDANRTVTGWMNSPEHRDNILNDNYSEVGFGMATAPDYLGKGPATVVVALYGRPVSNQIDISFTVPEPAAPTSVPAPQPYRNVSRIQMLTGGAVPWSYALLSAATLGGIIIFAYRHAQAWHRLLVRGEEFVLHHKLFDVLIVSLVVGGFVLTRAAGFIG